VAWNENQTRVINWRNSDGSFSKSNDSYTFADYINEFDFTSKDDIGVSTLVSLADYKNVRKTNLFSKRYLSGFYAKLPNLNKKV